MPDGGVQRACPSGALLPGDSGMPWDSHSSLHQQSGRLLTVTQWHSLRQDYTQHSPVHHQLLPSHAKCTDPAHPGGWEFLSMFPPRSLHRVHPRQCLFVLESKTFCLFLFLLRFSTFFCCCWSVVDLQPCVSFRCTAQWFSYTHLYLYRYRYSFSYSFPLWFISKYWI